MPPRSDEPLIKVNMNFFESDIIKAKLFWGEGYTSEIRALLRDHLRKHFRPRARVTEEYLEEDFNE